MPASLPAHTHYIFDNFLFCFCVFFFFALSIFFWRLFTRALEALCERTLISPLAVERMDDESLRFERFFWPPWPYFWFLKARLWLILG